MDKETRAIYAELSKPFGKGAVKSPPKGKYGNYRTLYGKAKNDCIIW